MDVLSRAGYQVQVCGFAAPLWSRIVEEPPALVFLQAAEGDQDPSLNFWGEAKRPAGVRLICVLERPGPASLDWVFKAGADDFLYLPAQPQEILGRVRCCLARSTDPSQPAGTSNSAPAAGDDRLGLEAVLERGKREWESVVDAVAEMVILTDMEHRIVRCNRATIEAFQMTFAALLGQSIERLLPGELVEEITAVSPELVEFRTPDLPGVYSAVCYPSVEDGKQRGFVFLLQDVTEAKRLEQMKSDFINRASHELRSPLTTALLSLRLIEQGGTDEELREYWGILRSELERQRILVERLLTVGRLETGNLKLNPETLQVRDVLDEALQVVASLAISRQINFVIDFSTDLMDVFADLQGLQQVFINLLTNAVKYSHPGGIVSITAQNSGEGVSVEVRDEGIGIPADELPRLFTRFFRASNATRNEIQGTGIGLFIVKSLLEEMNGTISVSSELDRGTKFEIWLPSPGAALKESVPPASLFS